MYTVLNLVLFNLSILLLTFLFSRIQKFNFLKILFLSIVISCYFGFRSLNIGIDTQSYYNSFLNLPEPFEPGFNLLNKFILTTFGKDHRIYFSIINFIMIMNLLFAFKLFVKYPTYIYSAWIIISLPNLILMQINLIRQGIALSYFVLGLSLFSNKKVFISFLVFLVSVSLHSSIIIYIISYFLSFLLNFKKDTKAILLVIVILFSLTNLPYELTNSVGITYFNSRFSLNTSDRESLPLLVKVSYYLFYYIIIEYFMINKNSSNKHLSFLSFIILSSALLIVNNDDVFSIRYLLALDILYPILFLSKSVHYKNNDYSFLTFISIIIVYLISLYTQEFILNFRF
jgi:hypothetical protein